MVADPLILLGGLVVVGGLGLVYAPLGVIALGALLIGVGLVLAKVEPRDERHR